MNPETLEYLKSIGLGARPLLAKAEEAYALCAELCPEPITHVFVSDHIKEDGTREYEDFECLAEHYLCCVRGFIAGARGLQICRSGAIWFLDMDWTKYDFKKAGEESRLRVSVSGSESDIPKWAYKAARNNCDVLMHLVRVYFKPRLESTTAVMASGR